jgi:ankyrin repeat domain-containing protein 50
MADCSETGYSIYPEQHGTYRGSCSWFEVRVRNEDDHDDDGELVRQGQGQYRGLTQRFQHNVHASWASRNHTNVWDVRDGSAGVREWLGALRCGDVVEVHAKAMYPGWANYVECAEVEVHCALV